MIPLLRTAEPETGQLAPGRGQNEDFETNSKQNTQIKVPEPVNKMSSIQLCFAVFKHSDWLFDFFNRSEYVIFFTGSYREHSPYGEASRVGWSPV